MAGLVPSRYLLFLAFEMIAQRLNRILRHNRLAVFGQNSLSYRRGISEFSEHAYQP